MKIYKTNIKLAEELTKYISPKHIEQARFERYNMPKINDGNLLCDEFFRTTELFNRKADEIKSFQPYGIDDLPIYDRMSTRALDLQQIEGSNSAYIESDLPYYIDIIGENKRIYLENYGTKSNKYPYEADIDTEYIYRNKSLYKNHSVDEVANIRYFAKRYSASDGYDLEAEALSLLNDGFPLESVIRIMKEGTLKSSDGDLIGSRGLMRFVSRYPGLKRYMVTYSNNKNEVFDYFGAKVFPDIVDMCNNNKKEAYKIIWDCRLEQTNGSFLTNLDFIEFAKTLYETDCSWTQTKSDIINFIKNQHPNNHKKLMKRVNKCLNNNVPLNDIIEIITPVRLKRRNLNY